MMQEVLCKEVVGGGGRWKNRGMISLRLCVWVLLMLWSSFCEVLLRFHLHRPMAWTC